MRTPSKNEQLASRKRRVMIEKSTNNLSNTIVENLKIMKRREAERNKRNV